MTIQQITLFTPLEDGLEALAAYGKPRIMRMDRGWLCYIAVHSAAKGASIEVQSESDCQTPKQAMLQCVCRLQDLVNAMASTASQTSQVPAIQ